MRFVFFFYLRIPIFLSWDIFISMIISSEDGAEQNSTIRLEFFSLFSLDSQVNEISSASLTQLIGPTDFTNLQMPLLIFPSHGHFLLSAMWETELYGFILLFEIIKSAVSSHLINLTSIPPPERVRRDTLVHIHSESMLQLGMQFHNNY